jgi:hypothetical protein
MNFLNPAILFGLFAAAIPLILHLLNLRKLKRVEFSSLKFIKELQKTKIRKIKLKQIILLILRTLIIAFIVLAFARPTVKSDLPLVGTYAKSSVVILLDNSFSMDVSDELGNRFKQAKSTASAILKSLKSGDEAAIIPMSDYNDGTFTLSGNFDRLKEELSRIHISNKTASFVNSVADAYSILEESKNLNKEIYLISDCQKNIFSYAGKDSLNLFHLNTSFYFINIGSKSKTNIINLSIDSLKLISQLFLHDEPVEIHTSVKNNSNKDISGLVVSLFYNNKRTAQTAINIRAGQTKTINMYGEPKDFGVVRAFAEIESDALDHDNRRYFGFYIPERPNVAVFGEKNVLPVETVLKLNESRIAYSTYKISQLGSINLSKYDMLIITDGLTKTGQFTAIKDYIEAGGSVLLFAGEGSKSFSFYSDGLKRLGINASDIKEYPGSSPLKFNYTDRLHPLFKGVFMGNSDSRKQVESPEIRKIIITKSGQKIISTPAGNILSEIRPGKGKLFFVSTGLNDSWSNFPLTGLFPVLIYRSVFYLTSREYTGITAQTGDNIRISLPKKYLKSPRFKIIDPKGRTSYRRAAVLPSSAILELNNLTQPGVYLIKTADDEIVEMLTVNVDASESIITKRDYKEIESEIGRYIDRKTKIKHLEAASIINNFTRARTGTELWQFFIFLAILTALAEMIVARNTKNELNGE